VSPIIDPNPPPPLREAIIKAPLSSSSSCAEKVVSVCFCLLNTEEGERREGTVRQRDNVFVGEQQTLHLTHARTHADRQTEEEVMVVR